VAPMFLSAVSLGSAPASYAPQPDGRRARLLDMPLPQEPPLAGKPAPGELIVPFPADERLRNPATVRRVAFDLLPTGMQSPHSPATSADLDVPGLRERRC